MGKYYENIKYEEMVIQEECLRLRAVAITSNRSPSLIGQELKLHSTEGNLVS